MRLLLVLTLVIWKWSFCRGQCPANTGVFTGDNRFDWTIELDGVKNNSILFGSGSSVFLVAEMATIGVQIDLDPNDLIIMEVAIETKIIKEVQIFDNDDSVKAKTHPDTDTPFPEWYNSTFKFPDGFETDNLRIKVISTSKEMKVKNVFVSACVPVQWCEWGNWGDCEVSCGTGQKTRERECKCANPDLAFDCEGSPKKTETCTGKCCPVAPKWGDWKKWSGCSVTCGDGTKTRSRDCIKDPCHDGTECPGKDEQTENCNDKCCPVAPNWGDWKKWSDCSETCGDGTKTRTRDCIKDPCHDGSECIGKDAETETCNDRCCPVPPRWSDWKKWSDCSVTCGEGTKTRTRDCIKDPCHDGSDCSGKGTQTEACNERCCPVAPNWGDWKKWGDCSVTCGEGTKTRTRECTKDPCHDGNECPGQDSQTENCNERCCPVAPNWGDWKKWGDCSVTCGEGTKTRTRECTKDPCHDGNECPGQDSQTENCNERCCPVAPNWGDWKKWGDCSVTCGEGTKTRTRECTKDPCHDGNECPGQDSQTENCNERCCPVAPNWGDWKKWGDCSVTCGEGTKTRTRECTKDPCHDGNECPGQDSQTENCNERCCPVAPNWGDWKKWGDCSVTCGEGTKTRTRECTKDPCHDGNECPGQDSQTENCNERCCPVAPNWGDWKKWGDCSVTCGEGTKTRTRECTKDPCHDGNECPGQDSQTENCNERCCPVAPTWSAWKQWSDCTEECGGGTKTRKRDCNKDPCHDGSECPGKDEQTMPCNEDCCEVDPFWATWPAWEDCPVTCGGGIQERSRKCNKDKVCPTPGKDCEGISKETKTCNDQCCPIAPKWTNWKKWSACSVSCGTGIQRRKRKCKKSKTCPLKGAKCSGKKKMTQPCEQPCCRERIDFNNRDGVEVTIVGGLATRDGSELLDGSGVTIDNILLDNIDGTEKVRITFIGGSRNIIEVGLETFLSDKAMVSSNPGPWNDSNVVDPYDGFQESTFNPPGGQIDNQDQVTLQFGYPTGEISVAGLYLIVCV